MSQKYPKVKTQRKVKRGELTLDAFVSQIYLPHIKIRKRSWKIDERIARQHLSPAFGDRSLSEIERGEVEDWLNSLPENGCTRPEQDHFHASYLPPYSSNSIL